METPETSHFNRPHKTIVAIDCRHIGDDNDYSCFLSDGHKAMAYKLALTDPIYKM